MNTRGLSLIEIMVAVAIMSMFIIPLIDVLATGHKGNRTTEIEITATLYADELMEQVCGMPFEHLPAEIEATDLNGTQEQIEFRGQATSLRLSPLPKGFSRSLTIVSPGVLQEEYLKLVQVDVRWEGKSGGKTVEQEVTFHGFVVP